MLRALVTSRLLPLLLLVQTWDVLQSHAHSLVINLTVRSQSRPGQPWCEGQGSMDEELILQYDSDSNEVRLLDPLGENIKATGSWTELPQTLGDLGQELRMNLPVISLEGNKTLGPSILQAKLSCQCEAGRCTGRPLKFYINEQTTLVLEPMSRNWTAVGPGAREVKEAWEKNGQMEYFRTFSMGDCNRLLRDILDHWEKVLETPVPPLQSSAFLPTEKYEKSTQVNIAWIIGGVFGSILLIISLVVWLRKSGRMKALHCLSRTSQGPSVETIRDVGGEELEMVSVGSPAELADVSGADPEVTRMCGEPLLPKSSCPFELIP